MSYHIFFGITCIGAFYDRLHCSTRGFVWTPLFVADNSGACVCSTPKYSIPIHKHTTRNEDVTLSDTTDSASALENAKRIVHSKYGTSTPCQIVVVTDGRPTGGKQWVPSRLLMLCCNRIYSLWCFMEESFFSSLFTTCPPSSLQMTLLKPWRDQYTC